MSTPPAPPVVIVRPQPGNAATEAAARAVGLDPFPCPLFAVEPAAWDCPDPQGFDALLVGSGNALRHAGDGLARLRALPVLAVGEATARAARDAGLTVTATGSADLAALVAMLKPPLRLLRLAGEEHVALVPPPGVLVETRVVYAVRAAPLPDALARQLEQGCVVLLHSAAAARHFAGECARHGIRRGAVALACLAPRVAEAAGTGWNAVAAAATPADAALLALAHEMCQTIRTSRHGRADT